MWSATRIMTTSAALAASPVVNTVRPAASALARDLLPSYRPNVLAVEFFLQQVWPLLHDATLHIIAGARHQRYAVAANLAQPGITMEGFVADVRPAYQRAALVVAPLVASAGTNIKALEPMGMGQARGSGRT